MDSEELADEIFVRFVNSFHPDNRPDVLAISGGEAMLRPQLVQDLADRARSVGCRTSALSGVFFARGGSIPPAIKRAIGALDHFSVSTDRFHEQEVPRAAVFRTLETLIRDGVDVSLHLVADGPGDPYVDEIARQVEEHFQGAVPMVVNRLSWFGRARDWLDKREVSSSQGAAEPCALTAWPVVGFDGTVVACGNDDALQNPPPHLRLGNIAVDDWPTIKARCLEMPSVRAIRLFGPEYLADRYAQGGLGCDGYCGTCMKLSQDSGVASAVTTLMARPAIRLMEDEVLRMQEDAGAASFMARHTLPHYAKLVTLGLAG